ncbi:MAG: tetratricopeptide repeat protein [Candidatus Acidiferrales bacterium]
MMRRIFSLPAILVAVFLLAAFSFLAVPSTFAQQNAPQRPGPPQVGLGTIRVNVRNATGAPLDRQAIVRISQRVGSIMMTESTRDAASAEFRGLPVGDYVIEVMATGFQNATEEATLYSPTNVAQVYVLLRAETIPGAAVAAGPPVLTPKALKEVQEAASALEKNDLKEAEKRLKRAEELAPNHPEVHYLLGILAMRRKDPAVARQRFEKAIVIYPQHAPALGALGRLLFGQGDLAGAVGALERALVVDARSRENHVLLAHVFFRQKNLEKARYHAEQALDIAAGKLPETRLLLSQILAAQGERKQAADVLEKFQLDYPEHPDAEAARRMMWQLRLGSPEGGGGTGASPSEATGGPAVSGAASPPSPNGGKPAEGKRITQAGARVLALASLGGELAPGAEIPVSREWKPKDVDETPPAVFRDVACAQEQVLERMGRRVMDLVDNLRDVNAAEEIIHTYVDAYGRPGRTEKGKYEYMFSIQRPKPNLLWVEEYRDGLIGGSFVGGIATTGLAAMALVFHPFYAGDFEMRCEGQGSWNGEAVWFVYFRQRSDVQPRIRAYRNHRGSARLPLKGRAWIAANTYQILRLETDLIAPLSEVRFESEHMVIEYGPVEFKERKGMFWLPSSADVYAHERGKRWHRRHTLTNYVHFAVDTRQKIATPDPPADPPLN